MKRCSGGPVRHREHDLVEHAAALLGKRLGEDAGPHVGGRHATAYDQDGLVLHGDPRALRVLLEAPRTAQRFELLDDGTLLPWEQAADGVWISKRPGP